MVSKKPRLAPSDPKARRSVFEYKRDQQNDISPFLNTIRSYLYQTRCNKNRQNVRDLEDEIKILREIMTLKNDFPFQRYFDVEKIVDQIKNIAGLNEDGTVVCPETQLENACKFLADKTGKMVVGHYYHEPHCRPKYVTAPFNGDLNLILVKLKNGKFATANTLNLFPKNGDLYCGDCRKYYQDSAKHTSKCRVRCAHCMGMGDGFPCPEVLPPGEWLKCESCFFEFKSKKCFDQHLITACDKKMKCQKCGQAANRRPGFHICGSSFCNSCYCIHPKNNPQNGENYCYIKKAKIQLQTDFQRVLYIIYDIETVPVYVSEVPKKRKIIPDANDSGDEGEDLEEMDGIHYYVNKIGTKHKDILPECDNPPFLPELRKPKDQLDKYGVQDLEYADDEEAEMFEDDMSLEFGGKSDLKHVPNLLVAKIRCSECIETISDAEGCAYCDHTTIAYTTIPDTEGAEEVENVCAAFRDELIKQTENEFIQRIFCWGHNAARFDTHLVVSEFINEGYHPTNLIMKGHSIIQTTFDGGEIQKKINFRDTYRIIPVGLKAFQATFELDPSIGKFDFPHLYNRPEFYDQVLDSLPHPEYYGYSLMKKDDQKKFMVKYERECQEMKERGEKYILREQLLKYCIQDVECLYQGFVAHRINLKDVTKEKVAEIDFEKNAKKLGKNSDPKYYDLLLRGTTIAALALYVYRLKFMKAETVGLVPESGYQSNVNQSKIAIAYMDWLMKKKNIHIRHAHNMGEYKIGDIYVDGYDTINKDVYQVMGCQYHGCNKCRLGDRSIIQWNGKSANELYAETVRKQKKLADYLEKHSFYYSGKIIEIWECEIAAERKVNKELDDFIKEHDDTSPINLRRTLTGGRTGPVVLEAEADDEYEIKVFDLCSLYPYINFATRYPTKHPFIQYNVPAYKDAAEIPEFCIMKCKILPPENLAIPIIPMKFKDQLLFPLCGKCPKELFDKNEQQVSCKHGESRAFICEITSIEAKYALQNNYRILQVYHVLQYTSGTDNLFKDYVREFLKMKVEASNPPEGYESDPEARKNFENLYRDVYGIELGNCKFNAGKRFISKIFLNSLWGKFSANTFEEKMIVANSELTKYMSDPSIHSLDYHCINDESILVRFKKYDSYTTAPNVNLMVSLWTTAAAKIHLYKFMKYLYLQEGVTILYTDTDSIIYKCLRRKPPLLNGLGLLGEMQDEFPNHTITHYRSGGAKQYFLIYKDNKTGEEKTSLKCRGIQSNSESEEMIKYKNMKYNPEEKIILKNTRIGPKLDFGIYTSNSTKIYKTICRKGLIVNNNTVFSYGHVFEKPAYMPPWNPVYDSFDVKQSVYSF